MLFEMFFNQVRDDLSVSLRNKAVIGFAQPVFELQIVFYDAVMDDDDAAGAVAMRMCVLFGGTSVRGPTRVADSVSAVERTQTNRLFEIAQLSFSTANLELVTFIDDRDARRVVTAILELPQPVDNERHDLFVAYVTNDSTHARFTPGTKVSRKGAKTKRKASLR